MTRLTVGSLFTGIGGLDLGLERAGMTVRWQVEKDEWCNQILARHWPNVPRHGDITALNPVDLDPVDVIAGGFPCQPVSYAGHRKAQADDRWLWPAYFRIIRHLRPRYVLVENVPGLASAGLGDVLGDLASIGYDTEWESIPASAVGAPHLRYRIFIVAYPHGDSQPGRPVHAIERPGELVSNSDRVGLEGRPRIFSAPRWGQLTVRSQWATEPAVGRMANGIPRQVDRLRGLGNAVVPQVAELVGHQIMAVESMRNIRIDENEYHQYQLTIGSWVSAWVWNPHDLQALADEVSADTSGEKYALISGPAKLSLHQPRNRPYSTYVKDSGLAARTTSVGEATVCPK